MCSVLVYFRFCGRHRGIRAGSKRRGVVLGFGFVFSPLVGLIVVRGFKTEAPLIENALDFYDVCRRNRNTLMHAWAEGWSSDGHLGFSRKSKAADKQESFAVAS
jgi:hypothetical protein